METKSLAFTDEDIRRGLDSTPEQRLNWLQEANEFLSRIKRK
jgi:hypothetical protein